MSIATLKACIVCEGARMEVGRKVTLLGVYGVTPDVGINVQDLSKPIDLTCVMYLGDVTAGTYQATGGLRMEHEGQELRSFPPMEMTWDVPPGVKGNFALILSVRGVVFPRPGRVILELRSGDEEIVSTSFDVRQGTPEDFT